jgi:hypothetical protein
VRVSGFFALSMACTCRRSRLWEAVVGGTGGGVRVERAGEIRRLDRDSRLGIEFDLDLVAGGDLGSMPVGLAEEQEADEDEQVKHITDSLSAAGVSSASAWSTQPRVGSGPSRIRTSNSGKDPAYAVIGLPSACEISSRLASCSSARTGVAFLWY